MTILSLLTPRVALGTNNIDLVPDSLKGYVDLGQLSGEPDPRDKIIKSCDNALQKCKTANNDKQTVIEAQNETIKKSVNRIKVLEDDADSFWNNPIVWFVTGGIFTGIVGFLIK